MLQTLGSVPLALRVSVIELACSISGSLFVALNVIMSSPERGSVGIYAGGLELSYA